MHTQFINNIINIEPTTPYPSSQPTRVPTNLPSINPTNYPTMGPIISSNLTLSPSTATILVTSDAQKRHNGNTYDDEENEEGFFILLPVIISFVTVCGFFVIICLLVYKYWDQRKEQQQQVKPLQFIQDEEDEVEEQKYADEKEEDVNVELLNEDRREVKKWLSDTVKLEIYFDLLIKHGYECMDFIKKITDKSELKSIGIIKKGHQTRMMKQINNLKKKKKKSINMHVPHVELYIIYSCIQTIII